ncbi:hypothetical protein [Streptomyces spectabilis]|uniref:Uncharacterized protein n=1 Tax=Streptomyces spectabilis TaxID=68270 RepID=A0A7W8B2A6_STRST|nr:hypothetical protein [Streptomyces spectabilis]MBB5107363.1 hypothetical protein [Streptomyces spectabilis]MCI3900053.1 hypothetical protein [Streptomyces spectabilis]
MSELSREPRDEWADLLKEMAESEADPARRAFLEGFPDGFGLVDEGVD